MVVITLVAVVVYLLLIVDYLELTSFVKETSLPDIDTTLLASFGIGQGAYLTKKVAGNLGTS